MAAYSILHDVGLLLYHPFSDIVCTTPMVFAKILALFLGPFSHRDILMGALPHLSPVLSSPSLPPSPRPLLVLSSICSLSQVTNSWPCNIRPSSHQSPSVTSSSRSQSPLLSTFSLPSSLITQCFDVLGLPGPDEDSVTEDFPMVNMITGMGLCMKLTAEEAIKY